VFVCLLFVCLLPWFSGDNFRTSSKPEKPQSVKQCSKIRWKIFQPSSRYFSYMFVCVHINLLMFVYLCWFVVCSYFVVYVVYVCLHWCFFMFVCLCLDCLFMFVIFSLHLSLFYTKQKSIQPFLALKNISDYEQQNLGHL